MVAEETGAKKTEEVKKEPTTEEPKAEEVKEEDKQVAKEDAKEEVKEEAKEEPKEEEKEETPKEPEPPKELEEDATPDKRAALAPGTCKLSVGDATLNVLPTAGDRLLMSLSDGGFQHLLAGVRGTVGVKTGRYMFEVKIVENRCVNENAGKGRSSGPRQLVRVGFSTATAPLLGTNGIAFDSEGTFLSGKDKKRISQKFMRGDTVAVLLNLDAASPNANTISLFKDGQRVTQPQPIPETLKGEVLYPTLVYKNVTLQVNFGAEALVPLPFTCRMLGGASKADVEVAKNEAPKDGKYEVVFPVSLPGEGTFDWLDKFLKAHPQYTEISDRAIIQWAKSSGLTMGPPQQGGPKGSNDKPVLSFGVPELDDLSVSKVLASVSPALKRHYVVMEVKGNLLAEDRKAAVARFGPDFKKVARVAMGEPPADWKTYVQDLILAQKKAKADVEAAKKKAEVERKRKLEESQKKAEAAKKARLAKKDGVKDAEKAQEEQEAPETKEAEEMVEAAPVELTEEEKSIVFRKTPLPDLSQKEIAKSYANFSIPEASEGFDQVSYEWAVSAKCSEYLKQWVLEKKLTQRVEDLKPSAWFKEESGKIKKLLEEWKKRQLDWKNPSIRKTLIAKIKAAKAQAKKEAAGESAGDAEGEDAAKKEEEVEELPEVNAEDVDVFSVEDVNDIGSGEPLFFNFNFQDWMLLTLRLELHLLVHAFRKDLDDPDRPTFSENHLSFYYQKYFSKSFTTKTYGCENFAALAELLSDTFGLDDRSMVKVVLAEGKEPTYFVQLAEEHRRDRQRRVDAGDETAELKFTKPAPPAPRQQGAQAGGRPAPASQGGREGYGSGGAPRDGGNRGYGSARPASASYSTYASGSSRGASAPASSYGAQKRPYAGGASYSSQPPAKAPRGGSYGASSGGSYGRGSYGGGSYGGGSYGGGSRTRY